MLDWIRSRHYKSYRKIMIAWTILGLFGQDKEIYPAQIINFSYGYSYYLFERQKN